MKKCKCENPRLHPTGYCFKCGGHKEMVVEIDQNPQAASEAVSAELALLSGQLEAACKLIGTIADCPFCFFGWETDECSDACNKFERGEGWECWKEYLAKQAI